MYNWGILGTGSIANQFANDLKLVEKAKIKAVASKTQSRAKSFADQHQVEKAYGTYEALIEDPEVDIVYVATPHDAHQYLSIKALTQGKHVLCEKPIALNRLQALSMIKASQDNKKFFMEAFWTRFNPTFNEVLHKVNIGFIGEVKYVNADFAMNISNYKSRMLNMENGGGSLLDMGVYPVFLAYMLLGKPKDILAKANFADSGADIQTSMVFQYDNAQAVLHSSFVAASNMTATISGSLGRINLHPVWHEAQSYDIIKNNNRVNYAFPTKGKGFTYEIEECHRCINLGMIESDQWSHQNSLDLIGMIDQIRAKIGLVYPDDDQ